MGDVEKNTVPSAKQTVSCVIKDGVCRGNVRILFIGNSMTYHGYKPDIGWFGSYGMAASCKENDYVHRLLAMLEKENIFADKCIVNAAEWERNYKTGNEVLKRGIYSEAVKFEADIIIVRILENCPTDNWERETFKKQFLTFLDYFNPTNNTKVILTTSFWRHKGSEVIEEVSKERGLQCVYMTDLGDKEEMKAIGKFEHGGVAIHPGDLGMDNMAKRLFPAVKKELNLQY